MERYRIKAASANFHSGILQLNDQQASARQHALEDLGDGLYEIKQPVQFKRGEELGFDGDVSKLLLEQLEVTDGPAIEDLKAPELIERIKAAETLDVLASLILKGEKRSTVLAAIKKREEELDEDDAGVEGSDESTGPADGTSDDSGE
ncbi:hypothetical protein [Geopsychrobacter electrodiphilus]|uniref:hypothetical protein n=1 Tax=Geopsychrobacter electrodiphilus TaxID=225196 RepID=UPI00035DAA5E|nr:hypothetical protein [Geopsychrobacter electrodiphilus]